MKSTSQDAALNALSILAGIDVGNAYRNLKILHEDYYVIEWDEAFKQYDILGDAVPRTQFLSYVRQRVANTYTESGKASLFASKASEYCELLGDFDCDFAEENKITTNEWSFQGETSTLESLP